MNKFILPAIVIFLLIMSLGYNIYLTINPKIKQVYVEKISYIFSSDPKIKYTINEILYYKTKYILEEDCSKVPSYLPEIISNVLLYTNEVDPELVLSMIYVESCFKKYDHNSWGARGLMQIVPRELKDFMKENGIRVHDVYDIDKNIFMGVSQLGWFIQDADQNYALALYRYNGAKIKKLKHKKVSLPKEGFDYLVKIFNIYYKYKNIKVGE